MLRNGPGLPVRMKPEDIVVHRTRNTPKCATVVLLDMSGSMRYNGLYIDVKRMGLALQGLIHRQYPGDHLQFIEVYTFAKPRPYGEIVSLLPKTVSIDDPVVRLRVDMSNPDVSELRVPAALHEHPAGAAIGPPLPGGPGHAQPAGDSDYRRPADGPFRGQISVPALSARSADRSGDAARRTSLPARSRSRSTSSCCPPGRSRAKTCSLPTGWPNRPRAESSSPPARIWTATCCGTISAAAARSCRRHARIRHQGSRFCVLRRTPGARIIGRCG